jgi:ribosomal protein L37E
MTNRTKCSRNPLEDEAIQKQQSASCGYSTETQRFPRGGRKWGNQE